MLLSRPNDGDAHDAALKQEHQMLTPFLFGPNEHVAVTDRSLQQGVCLCLVDASITPWMYSESF